MAQQFLKTQTPTAGEIGSIEEWKQVRKQYNSRNTERNRQIKEKYTRKSEHQTIEGVPVLVVTPKSYDPKKGRKILLYIHGGAYTLGKPDFLYADFAPLADRTGLKVYAVDYRLAPEHPFPAALEDALKVYRNLQRRVGARNIAILGDSAGGALSLSMLLKAHAEGLPMPAAVVLYSPWSDIDKIGDTYYTLSGVAPILDYDKNLRSSAQAYAKGHDMKDPLISPVYGHYERDFPPTLIQVGTRDIFLSNCVRLYRTMKRSGAPAELSVWEGMWHVFESLDGLPEAQEAVAEAASFLDKHMQTQKDAHNATMK